MVKESRVVETGRGALTDREVMVSQGMSGTSAKLEALRLLIRRWGRARASHWLLPIVSRV